MPEQDHLIHALGHPALTPFYDVTVGLLMRERTVRQRLIDRLSLAPGLRVLDIGSGTSTLALMIKRQQPDAEVSCVDGDPVIVELARRKIEAAGVPVSLHVGLATALPFADRSFDRVTTTFVVHHLTAPNKERTFAEALRVLRPGGEIHIVDIGPPKTPLTRVTSRLIPKMLESSGFVDVIQEDQVMTAFAALAFLRARAPAP